MGEVLPSVEKNFEHVRALLLVEFTGAVAVRIVLPATRHPRPLPAARQPLFTQITGLLEKLAQQAVGAQLTDLSRDEFAALLTQVLPQALPPQHVQAALSPHALNAYQALAKFLHRTGAAIQGDGLLQGVKLVRQLMTEQIRRSGILGGPDYSDPDEKKPAINP